MLAFIILAIGLMLIFFEFYLPGGVMGALGTITVIASIIVFAVQNDSIVLILLFSLGAFAALGLLFRYALWRIKNASSGKGVYSNGDQAGYTASYYDTTAVGKVGVVDTDLKPGGHVLVGGERHLAISESGYISKGTKIKVTGGQGESLTVKHYKKEKKS